MGLFSNSETNTKQGDIGEARAIYEYTRLGYGVSRPLNDSMKYDLIIDSDSSLYKVQVKTTKVIDRNGSYVADIRTNGGNQSFNTSKNREDSDYDLLFVLTDSDECYSIPTVSMKARAAVTLGNAAKQYKL